MATIVAERLGFTHDEALTLGRAVAGLNAYSKGRALGIFKPTPKDVRAKREAKAKAKQVSKEARNKALVLVTKALANARRGQHHRFPIKNPASDLGGILRQCVLLVGPISYGEWGSHPPRRTSFASMAFCVQGDM